jgi:hypothetical protein
MADVWLGLSAQRRSVASSMLNGGNRKLAQPKVIGAQYSFSNQTMATLENNGESLLS